MTAVELGADLDVELEVAHRGLGPLAVRRGTREVATQRDEGLRLALLQRRQALHGVVALRTRHADAVARFQRLDQPGGRLLVDTHGAIALDVGMATHRTGTGTGTAEVPPEQQQIDDLAHTLDGMQMLGDAHRPGADDVVGTGEDGGRLLELSARQAGLVLEGCPLGRLDQRLPGLDAPGMRLDEAGGAREFAPRLHREQRLGHAAHRRHVAAHAWLVIAMADGLAGEGHHLQRRLRVGKALQPPLTQRIEADDACATP